MRAPTLRLAAGRDRSLRRRHPWVFSGAVDRVQGDPEPGETVVVRDAGGAFLAHAAWSPESQIVARVWSFAEDDAVDDAFFAGRVGAAAAARADLLEGRTDAARLVFGESDGLPGVIVDRYADVAVVQLSSAGADRWRDAVADACLALDGVRSVYERSDVDVRTKEGLAPRTGLLRGDEPPPLVDVAEDGARFGVDVRRGHKTGFYLDQRESRAVVRLLAARAPRVLNVFGYTGAFAVAALAGGAGHVTTVDSSQPALDQAADNLARNGIAGDRASFVRADAFRDLRVRRDAGETFDLVVLDPPKLAHHKGQVDRASRAYKDLNWLAMRLLAPGGRLVTFSCSGAVDDALFRKILAGAALDAGRDAVVERWLTQATDHPVPLAFPEAAYLNGAVVRVP